MKKLFVTTMATAALAGASQAADWTNSFDLGATVAKGNSDSALVTAGFSTIKVEDKNEYAANLSYTYGEDKSTGVTTTTNDELIADARWNHLFTDRFYAGARLDVRTDALADIDYRATLSSVVGYYLIKDAKTSLAVEGGVGISTEQVASISDTFWSVYVGERFEHKFNDKTRIYQSLSITAPADRVEDYSLIGEAGVETFLSDTLSLKVFVQDKFENRPASGLKKNDIKLVTGISYKF